MPRYRLVKPYITDTVYESTNYINSARKFYSLLKKTNNRTDFIIKDIDSNQIYTFGIKNRFQFGGNQEQINIPPIASQAAPQAAPQAVQQAVPQAVQQAVQQAAPQAVQQASPQAAPQAVQQAAPQAVQQAAPQAVQQHVQNNQSSQYVDVSSLAKKVKKMEQKINMLEKEKHKGLFNPPKHNNDVCSLQ
ncbi:hypothetical protein BMW23_0711 [Bodo saltans virus]|uniref:Uncharacterized protein n=1 Tax=Bodo saltans virus TaxID=2024608 RepID=A0A2H4UV66_9VIRU|nr:hypothetical protein QJ851_gp0694 [Bodo saltans virus]ATZ80757.1 hypothetical protein BMW23_0711 [Bodo saltans virus]